MARVLAESLHQPGMMCSLTSDMMAFHSSPSSGALSGSRGARYPGSTCDHATLEGLGCATARQSAFCSDGAAAQVTGMSAQTVHLRAHWQVLHAGMVVADPVNHLVSTPTELQTREGLLSRALIYHESTNMAQLLGGHVTHVMHHLPPPHPLDVCSHELHEKIHLYRCCDHCWQVLPF